MTIADELLTRALWRVQQQRLHELPNEEELNHAFSKRFERRMKKLIKWESFSSFQKKINTFSKRAAMFVLVLALAMFTTVVSVSALRTQFFQMVSDMYQKYSEIYFPPNTSHTSQIPASQSFVPYTIGSVPKGYHLVSNFADADMKISDMEYENDSKNRIGLKQENIATANFDVNTEGVTLQDIQVNGEKAFYYENKGMHTIVWHDDQYAFLLYADGTPNLDKDAIIKIAESIAPSK